MFSNKFEVVKKDIRFVIIFLIFALLHLQQFEPGYTAPRPLFRYGGIPMNFRYVCIFAICVLQSWFQFFCWGFGSLFFDSDSPNLLGIFISRGNWEIPTRELHAPPFIPMFTTDREYLDSDFEEEYPLPSPRSVMCCRIVAIIVRLSLPPPHPPRTLCVHVIICCFMCRT
jgi:hypothetical protein